MKLIYIRYLICTQLKLLSVMDDWKLKDKKCDQVLLKILVNTLF